VNPTDLGLPPAIERRRYALKARLQSLLVREFPDEIVVAPVSGQEGVVALHYRPHDRDACHAVVSELEDAARSFVRLQLDLATSGGTESGPRVSGERERREGRRRSVPAPASRLETEDPRQLVRLGRDALESYDFERAQACFEEAFSRSGGGAPEAVALLEFLVDQLAAYPAALEHGARLSSPALRDERVRALLAFAAANVGDVTASRRFIAGAEGHHAAAAWVLLGRYALERSDLTEAESCLAAARRIEPGLPDLVALAADAARLKAESRRQEEEELARLLAAGDEEAAARKAEAILGRWPESASARRVRSEVEARRRAREAEALRRQGEEAYAAARFDDALAAWRGAEALGAAGLEAKIAEASSRAEARLREERIGATEAALTSPASPESLSAYLGLDPAERQILRARTKLPELEWLEELGRATPGRDRGPDVLAVAWNVVADATVPDACPDTTHVLVGSSAAGAVFVQFEDDEGMSRCAAFSLDRSRALERLWTCEIPEDTVIARDAAGVQAALLWPTARGSSAVILGREAPVCAGEEMLRRHELPALQDEYFCAMPPAENPQAQRRISVIAQTAKDQPSDEARARYVDEVIVGLREDPVELVRLAEALRSRGLTGEASTVQAFARRFLPAHPRVWLDEAEELARGGDWARLRELLSGVDASRLDARGQAHVHHLRGLALYHDGRYEEAAVEFGEAARAPESACSVAGWEEWLRFLARPPMRRRRASGSCSPPTCTRTGTRQCYSGACCRSAHGPGAGRSLRRLRRERRSGLRGSAVGEKRVRRERGRHVWRDSQR
jgi:tetratricopeptide (TPR) repeat protein